MKADQIKSAVLNAIQTVTDEMGMGLGVGPLNQQDWNYLSGGYGLLNWEMGLTKYGNEEWSFDVALKLAPNMSTLDAAILGVYRLETDTLEMHLVESFVRTSVQHSLKGHVFAMMIIASYLYIAAADGTYVRLMDVEPELMDYYRIFGFRTDGPDMVQTVEELAESFITIVESAKAADR
ncbi:MULTISPECIES: hypothetical protein [Aeromonas]|uniref:hypothetical protein n=1 Tax=Aeromonas caviae TaxID=648 RepID=UPI0025B683CA|nr:hypothetical protein [Aeromonas caviae]